jgi:hypothetical protein
MEVSKFRIAFKSVEMENDLNSNVMMETQIMEMVVTLTAKYKLDGVVLEALAFKLVLAYHQSLMPVHYL